MSYFCFFCNELHEGAYTEEHFIPRSIDAPEYQWLPVCSESNARSNSVFDNDARDILFVARHEKTGALKRTGDAILEDGSVKQFKFSFLENREPERLNAFQYIFDRETNTHVPMENVYAIMFPCGLTKNDKEKYCRGLAKISIGALVYLLEKDQIDTEVIEQIYSQDSVDVLRHFALDHQWKGEAQELKFSLGRAHVLEDLQVDCQNKEACNHVIQIRFLEDNSIQVNGMLYSCYGWKLRISNDISVSCSELRLENAITGMNLPEKLKDTTMSHDSICIINPDFIGQKPNIPEHWG